eukprot:CAMPEP_0170326300 /NCGR_PEP_ID=MMETSP0116_2-20130129/64024_1 /TAXON_ID=400756 /ORGANISM="Durinskia baltica, Strain CSIRO CS-38" /LENGTH=79 /DNA_ID=CAMNT_0010579351 /DNA_START=283 /DNA_END=518 /DNA_ORIENTATION=-
MRQRAREQVQPRVAAMLFATARTMPRRLHSRDAPTRKRAGATSQSTIGRGVACLCPRTGGAAHTRDRADAGSTDHRAVG